MSDNALHILVLCTGNSARSIMAEALINALGRGKLRAFSAGSRPTGTVHPLALETLKSEEISAEGARSKSWSEFSKADAPRVDVALTVCSNATAEPCPVWTSPAVMVHWAFDDPAAATGSLDAQRAVFKDIFDQIRAKIERVVALDLHGASSDEIQRALQTIGDEE